jgi:hypothetical protein
MRLSLRKLPRTGLALAAVAVMAFGAVAPALADSGGTGSVTVTGGALSETNAGPATVGTGVTLDGTNKTSTFTLPITVSDLTGSGAGWHLLIGAATFNNGTDSLATNAMTVTAGAASCVTPGSGCTELTTGNAAPFTTVAAPASIFSAAVQTGMGVYSITPSFSVAIPGSTHAGVYTSVITVVTTTAP